MIDEAASRGADLTQHLLAFATQAAARTEGNRRQYADHRHRETAAANARRAVEIESVFEDEACPAIVDPNQLATAILNLALNARDAMPDGGKLIIETGFGRAR
jgi:signal transduction histidine kinase